MIDFIDDIKVPVWKSIGQNKLDEAINFTVREFKKLPSTPFHSILEQSFTNDPDDVAAWIWDFISKSEKEGNNKAFYFEMNGFSINPDLWFVGGFAFDICESFEDYDWLADWKSSTETTLKLRGLENIQKLIIDKAHYERETSLAWEFCELLIVLKLHKLFSLAFNILIEEGEQIKMPIIVNAHDDELEIILNKITNANKT